MVEMTDRQLQVLDRLIPDRSMERLVVANQSFQAWSQTWGRVCQPDQNGRVDKSQAKEAWEAWLQGMFK